MSKTKADSELNQIPLFDSHGKKIDTVELDKNIFNGNINKVLLYQSVTMYRANQRRGTAATKTRGDVRGGGKKPWRQKGTGRARFGSTRNPVWRSGGIAFGPHPRDFRYSMPKKMKRSAFISSLNAKLKSRKILALEEESIDKPKTRDFAKRFKRINIKKERVLLLAEKIDKNLYLASRNIKNLTLKKINEATALDVLSNEHIVMTKKVAEYLNKKVTQ
ncbi:MAG: 50S ribosomal protein L4 [Candidatus Omnitrophota bacterium]|nr:MAG: 50S ribosomal protein L4 [Candidatus Omnitrophota bacterium]